MTTQKTMTLTKKTMGALRHKFKAKPVNVDGHHFPSTAEARYKAHLDLLIKAGEVLFYLRQVPFHLPSGEKYVVDFIVFYSLEKADGEIEFIDVKGYETRDFKRKKKLVEDNYPIVITVIKMRGSKIVP